MKKVAKKLFNIVIALLCYKAMVFLFSNTAQVMFEGCVLWYLAIFIVFAIGAVNVGLFFGINILKDEGKQDKNIYRKRL